MSYFIKILVAITLFCPSMHISSTPKNNVYFLPWLINNLPHYISEGGITIEYNQQENTLSIALIKGKFVQLSSDWASAKGNDKDQYTPAALNHRLCCTFDRLAKDTKNNLLKISTRNYKFTNVESNDKLSSFIKEFNLIQNKENEDLSYLDDPFYLNGK